MADNQKKEQTEIVEVTPVESSSENFLVTENLQRMPNIFARGLLYLIILIVIATLIYSLVSKIDIVVECHSVVRPSSHKMKVISDRYGYIEKIFISEGQKVKKNAPLFLVSSKEALTYQTKVDELYNTIPLKKEYYNTKTSSIYDELSQLNNDYINDLKVKKLKLEQNNISLNSIKSDLNFWQKEVETLAKEFENTQKLFEKQLTSITEYNNIKSRLERARTEINKLNSQQSIILKENNIMEKEIEKLHSTYKAQKSILGKQIKSLKIEEKSAIQSLQKELEMNEKMLSIKDNSFKQESGKGKIIRTEQSGIISELYFRNTGEYIRESDLLCTIIPDKSPLYMDITVANKDIGFLKSGMAIKYKFDAFPYTDYGGLYGKVSLISPSAIEDNTLGFIYRIQGTLDKTYFEIEGKKYFIKPGMTATAELITKKKSIFSILVEKLKK